MSVFPNAVLKMVDEINPWYYCQSCKYFEQEGYWFPNSDDTDDLFMCTWCWDNQCEAMYYEKEVEIFCGFCEDFSSGPMWEVQRPTEGWAYFETTRIGCYNCTAELPDEMITPLVRNENEVWR